MLRFRIINPKFDTRARLLAQEIADGWDEHIKQQWIDNKNSVIQGLEYEFGSHAIETKIGRFVELAAEPFSVIAYHNTFLRQCRYAYVLGSAYPALVGACALGERILNHLVIALRDDFKHSPEYKTVYDKESFDNWDLVIDVLTAWDVLGPGAADAMLDLKVKRNAAIHFNPATDDDADSCALDAIRSLQLVVDRQFGPHDQPWLIPGASHPFVRKESEEWPFVRRVVLTSPSVAQAGPKATLEFDRSAGRFVVSELGDVGPKDGTDEEFVALLSAEP